MNIPTDDRLPPLPHVIDSTMLVQFRACPKKFEYEYAHNLRPAGRKVDLVAGGAFAAGLEAAYQAYFNEGKGHDKAMQAAYKAFRSEWGDFPETTKGSTKTATRTFAALLDYFNTYSLDKDHVRPMLRGDGTATYEFSFAIPLDFAEFPRHPDGSPFIYAGRFDAFGMMGKTMVIRDEKTSGRAPSHNWTEQWNLRNQFLGYVWAAQASGYPVDTVVVRGVTIQATQFYQVEAIKKYDLWEINRFVNQLQRDLHRMVDCWQSGYFDYNLGDTCTSYGLCSYHQLCSTREPEIWFGEYSREKWDPITRSTEPTGAEEHS